MMSYLMHCKKVVENTLQLVFFYSSVLQGKVRGLPERKTEENKSE